MTADVKDEIAPRAPEPAPQAPPRPRGRFPLTLAHLTFGLFGLACVVGALVALQPQEAGVPGLILLSGITVIGAIFFHLLSSGRWAPSIVPQHLFSVALDIDPKPSCITGADGSAIYANRAWRRNFGQSPTGGIVLPVVAFSSDQESGQRMYKLVRAASHGRAHQEELKLKGPSAQWAQVSATPLSRNGHTIWRVVDVSKRQPLSTVEAPRQNVVVQFKPLENKPREPMLPLSAPSELAQRFQRFFSDAPVGIAILDAQGRIVECNTAVASLTGVAYEGLRGRLFVEALRDTSAAEVRARLAQLHTSDAAIGIAPSIVRFKPGNERTAQLFASRLRSGGDLSEAAAVLYLIDTTDQTQLESQFQQSQKMQAVGQLAGGIAHDFNNLLTVINGVAELLMQRHPPGDPSFQDIHQIRATGLRAAGLVRQLLAFSRRQELLPEVISITDVVSDWSNTLRRLIGERVQLKVEHGRDLWPVMADANQIGNVLMNLAVNARDAMATGGVLSIRTANLTIAETRTVGPILVPPGEFVSIEVEDTGTGIHPENLGKIFEPFFTTKEKGQGTGLGLSTVYGIVRQTGGFIFPESEIGKGTLFRIYLPRFKPEEGKAGAAAVGKEPQTAAPSLPAGGRDAQGMRDLTGNGLILLVEDEAAVRDFASRALSQRGYTVVEASNGDEALEILRAKDRKFDLLVSDVVMPGLDGPSLVKAVRDERPDMHIMFISGYAEEAFRAADLRIEDFHFLPKPFSLKQLTAKVKDVLDEPLTAR